MAGEHAGGSILHVPNDSAVQYPSKKEGHYVDERVKPGHSQPADLTTIL